MKHKQEMYRAEGVTDSGKFTIPFKINTPKIHS